MAGLIPQKHYNYLRNFFTEELAIWNEIKNDVEQLKTWARALKDLGWYNTNDSDSYQYTLKSITTGSGAEIIRTKL